MRIDRKQVENHLFNHSKYQVMVLDDNEVIKGLEDYPDELRCNVCHGIPIDPVAICEDHQEDSEQIICCS